MAMRYVYQLSLSNGKVLINESDGLFSMVDENNPDDKVLINSAVLVKMFEKEEEVPQSELNEDVPADVSSEALAKVESDSL